MGFEKFEDTGRGRGGGNAGPKISLRKSGSVGVNRAALEEFFDDSTEAVVMYYDEEEDRVGMEQVEDKDSEDAAYTLTRSDSGGSITPTAFLQRNSLVPEVTTQYLPETHTVNQNLELVTIDLEDGVIGTYGSPDEEDKAEEEETAEAE